MSEERKNGNIFSLYSREKMISHTDDQKRKVEVLLIKMTQRERSAALEVYYKEKAVEEKRLREDEAKNKLLGKTIDISTKEQLIIGILDYEEVQRGRFADLFPFEDEEKLTKKEKEKKKKELITKWREDRQKALNSEKIEDLRKMLLEVTFDGLSLLEGGRKSDYAALSFMCRHPKTREKIFRDFNQVEEVRDRRVLDWLLRELRDFRKEEFSEEEQAREEAKSPDFTQNGGSQKPSEKAPATKA